MICCGHDRLEADAQALLLVDAVGVLGHEPEHALGTGVAADSAIRYTAAPLDPTRTRLPGLSGRLSAA